MAIAIILITGIAASTLIIHISQAEDLARFTSLGEGFGVSH